MKSKNQITLSGRVLSVTPTDQGERKKRTFSIAHYFKAGKKPLFMNCEPSAHCGQVNKGDEVTVTGYLSKRDTIFVTKISYTNETNE